MNKTLNNSQEPLLSVKDLKTFYPIKRGLLSRTVGYFKAVCGVDFDIQRGEVLGIAGESGCGKSTLARTIVGLEHAYSGDILYEGQPIQNLSYSKLSPYRTKIQMIFQDPYSFLNPMYKIGAMLAEPLKVYDVVPKKQINAEVERLLKTVGLNEGYSRRYPSEFSGGERQRIGIAKALSVKPDLLICDEPVSALDVSIQAQILNLMKDLQDSNALTYIFISHGLDAVRFISDRVAIMYLGRFVEIGSTDEIYNHPQHPYTVALMNAYPSTDPHMRDSKRDIIEGGADSKMIDQPGCSFYPRCRYATERCKRERPNLVGDDHKVACFKVGSDAAAK